MHTPETMNNNILSTSGKAFQKFISNLTEKLPRPKAKFIRDLLCGIIFSDDLILTHIASKVPQSSSLTAIAKRFLCSVMETKVVWLSAADVWKFIVAIKMVSSGR